MFERRAKQEADWWIRLILVAMAVAAVIFLLSWPIWLIDSDIWSAGNGNVHWTHDPWYWVFGVTAQLAWLIVIFVTWAVVRGSKGKKSPPTASRSVDTKPKVAKPTGATRRNVQMLEELHRSGVLSDQELKAKKSALGE